MADNDQSSDEYQFADIDGMDNNSDISDSESHSSESNPSPDTSEKNSIKRIFLVFVPLMVVMIVLFKIFNAYFVDKPSEKKLPAMPPVTASIPSEIVPPPVVQSASLAETKLNDKFTVIDDAQRAMRTDMASMNEQLNGVATNVENLVTKITELNMIIQSLNMRVDEQAHRIDVITAKMTVKKVPHRSHAVSHRVFYHVEAAIPGRAWLMGSDGSTLTVRKGSMLPGYGIVTFIDPNQGRVSINSGQVIRFSKDDN